MDEQMEYLEEIQERTISLLINLSNSYFDQQAEISQQKRVISAQGNLINQCMERIMTLEGRGILGNFNQRLEQLEANRGRYYAIAHHDLPLMMKELVKRVDELESWLYTHDHAYFQEQEKESGNSSFEEYEMHHQDPSFVEVEVERLDCEKL